MGIALSVNAFFQAVGAVDNDAYGTRTTCFRCEYSIWKTSVYFAVMSLRPFASDFFEVGGVVLVSSVCCFSIQRCSIHAFVLVSSVCVLSPVVLGLVYLLMSR